MTIHKAAPLSGDEYHCQVCGQVIKRVTGGHEGALYNAGRTP